MKNNEFMRLEEKCTKCQNSLMLQKTRKPHLQTSTRNSHERKKLALRKPEKILTDIRNYLVEARGNWKERNKVIGLSLEQSLVDIGVDCWIDKALADLTEYAEKLGVEL